MIKIISSLYILIGLWAAFNTLFKGGPLFTDILIQNNTLNLIIAVATIFCWPVFLLIPAGNSILNFFSTIKFGP
jgi:hypothetical protein